MRTGKNTVNKYQPYSLISAMVLIVGSSHPEFVMNPYKPVEYEGSKDVKISKLIIVFFKYF